MTHWKTIADIRREYGNLALTVNTAAKSPFEQFHLWFQEVLASEASDPTAMVLSTVDEDGCPDSRVVLLKGIQDEQFVFFTNYKSAKAQQIGSNQKVSMNFYWPQMARQVRVKGIARKTDKQVSDEYFSSRPELSQYSAVVSPQSQAIPSRELLERQFNELVQKHQQKPLLRPNFWGGYQVSPFEFEFWQGRDNRLHDRIQYTLKDHQWHKARLAP